MDSSPHSPLLKDNPINTIPDELLSSIFLSREPPDDSVMGRTHWMNVTGVCRRWRQVALDTPRLWSKIGLSSLPYAQESFRRSKDAPLNLFLDGKLPQTPERVDLTAQMSNSNRIQRLRMFDYSPAEIASVFSSFAQPSAPLLECLVVNARHEENDPDSRLPGDVIWRDLPSLRYLAFTSIFIPTRFSLLPQLTELTLQTRLLTVTWFLEVLANAPRLRRIFVCGQIRSDEDIPSSTKQISLPSLASLHIYMSSFKPLNMFDFITLAPTTYIYLYLCNFPPQQGPSTEPWRAASLQSLLSRRLKGIESIDSLTLGIRYRPTTEFYISISTPIKQYTDLTLPMVTQSHADACVRLFESLPITKVTSLHLTDYMKPEVPWSRLISLPLFEKIQALHVSYPFMDLIDDTLYNEDPSETPFRFPNLVDIFFLRHSYSSSHLSSKFKAMILQRKEIGKIVRVHQ